MRNFVSIFSITAFLLLLWQCNPMFEKEDQAVDLREVKNDIQSEKQQLAEELRDCSDHIARRLDVISEQIGKSNNEAKKSLKDLQKRLDREKKKVDSSLDDIEKSTSDTWVKVKGKSKKTLTDAKIEGQKVEERIEDLIN